MKLLKKVKQIFNTGFTMHQELTMQKKIFHLVFDIIIQNHIKPNDSIR